MNRKRKYSADRRGAAAVEFAIVMPVFVLMIVGAIELCHMNICKSILINETREAARLAINVNANASTISSRTISQVADLLNTSSDSVCCEVKATAPNGTERATFSAAIQGDLVKVTVTVPYNGIAIFASSFLSSSLSIRDTCIMEKE